MTLLSLAQGVPPRSYRPTKSTAETLELALALLRGLVTATQAAIVLKKKPSNIQQWAFCQIRDAVRTGRIVIEERQP